MNITFSGPQQVMISSGDESLINDEDFQAYFGILGEAFQIHLDKERIRKALWKDYPAEDQSNQIKVKIDRIIRSLERLRQQEADSGPLSSALRDNILEELYDIINYSVFAARLVEPGDLG